MNTTFCVMRVHELSDHKKASASALASLEARPYFSGQPLQPAQAKYFHLKFCVAACLDSVSL